MKKADSPERHLCLAVLVQGKKDAERGDPGAIDWLQSLAFRNWCEWAELNPDEVRRRIRIPRRRVPLFIQPTIGTKP